MSSPSRSVVCGIAVLLLGRLASAQAPGAWLGEAHGTYSTGTLRTLWTDAARPAPETDDPDDRRRLTIQVWYPVDAPGAERATYAADITDYDQWTQDNWGLAAARPTRSYLDAELSGRLERYPVILYSHGFGNPVFSGTYQTEFLASHGFVVVGIGHTGWDARMRYPDGGTVAELSPPPPQDSTDALSHVERYRAAARDPFMRSRRETALADLRFVIDELARQNEARGQRFFGRLDLGEIGAVGFSSGGADDFEATLTEPRIVAAVNLDGGLNGYSVLERGAAKPILLIQASDGFPRVTSGPTDPGLEELASEVDRDVWRMLRLTAPVWYKATIDKTVHPFFTDALLIVPPPAGMIAPARAHYLVNRVTLEFLDRFLRGGKATPILDFAETFDDMDLVTSGAETR